MEVMELVTVSNAAVVLNDKTTTAVKATTAAPARTVNLSDMEARQITDAVADLALRVCRADALARNPSALTIRVV